MATFVLIHGAWHGGWSWQPVAARLEALGHDVSRPTLSGLGERAHLATREIDLSVHVQDVAAHVFFENLTDVVLVGHSYAGMVITGVATAVPERLRRLVYYDAFVPDDGDSALDLLPETIAEHFVQSAEDDGDGWLMPRRPLSALGVRDESALAFLEPRLTEHLLATYAEKLRLDRPPETPGSFVSCTDWAQVFRPQADRARARGWPVREIAADHEALATAPGLLATALIETLEH